MKDMLSSLTGQDVGVHVSARRRHVESRRKYSHFDGTWEELRGLVCKQLSQGNYESGRHPGSLVVQMKPDRFFSMTGAQYDEKNGWLKPAAVGHVQVILYEQEALRQSGRRPSTNAPYEIVSIRA